MTQRKVIVRGATNQALDELDATDIPDLSATYEAAGATSAHTGDTSDAHDASAISFTPAGTIAATDVQAAIEEVAAEAGGAPTNADYLVGTANGGLSAEIVVGTTPGGELGGTWASPTVDATHSGSAHHTEDHDHDGSPTQKLAQANTHESADTDTGTGSLHHTIGSGANQAAAGNHGHSAFAAKDTKIARNAAVAINDTNYVTLGSASLSVTAGDIFEIEAWGQIRNDNSGGARTYTYCIDFGGVLIEIADGNTVGQSTTSRVPFHVKGLVSVVSSSSVELDGWLDTGALVATATAGNVASGSFRALWATSSSDVTGTITLAIKVKSSNASATQTGWLISARATKVGG